MEDKLRRRLFAAHLNETFRLHVDAETVLDMTLVEVKSLKPSVPRNNPWDSEPLTSMRREPFSMIFRGSLDQPLPQRMYRLDHPEMGSIENLFLVPVGKNQEGMFYESLVN